MANEQSYAVSQDDHCNEDCALQASVAGRREPTADRVWSTTPVLRAAAAAACRWVMNTQKVKNESVCGGRCSSSSRPARARRSRSGRGNFFSHFQSNFRYLGEHFLNLISKSKLDNRKFIGISLNMQKLPERNVQRI
jgi:hypothetical protein